MDRGAGLHADHNDMRGYWCLGYYRELAELRGHKPARAQISSEASMQVLETLLLVILPYGTAILLGALGERLGGNTVSALASVGGLVLGIYFIHRTLEIILAS